MASVPSPELQPFSNEWVEEKTKKNPEFLVDLDENKKESKQEREKGKGGQ